MIKFETMNDEQKKNYLKTAIVVSFIPLINFGCYFFFDRFILAENYRWWHLSGQLHMYSYQDKKKRWVLRGGVFAVILLFFGFVFLSDIFSASCWIHYIFAYLFPVALYSPLFLYDWNKYVIKGEPWPKN